MAGAWRHRCPDPSHLHGSKVRFARDSPLVEGVWSEPVSPVFAGLGTNFPTYKRLTAGTQTIFFRSRGACGTQHFPSISASFRERRFPLKC
jgi:hypothetical protein